MVHQRIRNRFVERRRIAKLAEQVKPSARSAPLPLSFQQERLWFLDRLDASAGSAYHIESALELTGPLDIAALGEALKRVVDRHEGLRAAFASSDDGGPVQVISPTADAAGFSLGEEDASDLDEAALAARVRSLLGRPFDLASGPLFRAHLLVCGPQRSVLVVGGHHAVLDGWSVGLLLREVAALYREALTGEPSALPDLAIQYGDYAAWQRSVLSGDRLEAEMAWWCEALAGIPEAISLPFDRPRPRVMDYRGGTVAVHIPADVTAGLKALAGSHGATLFMVLDAAFAAFLHRIGGDHEIVIGTAVAGRPRSELEPLAGFFVNTIALRHEVDGLESFTDFLGRTRQLVLEAFQHQTVPFETVVEAVSPARSLGHAPVVQVMLVLQNMPDADAALTLPDMTVRRFLSDDEAAKFDLSLSLTERTEGLVGGLSYARQLFDAGTAERLAAMFVRLLSAAVRAPEMPVFDLPLLDDAERHQVVRGFNDTAADYARDKTVVDLFAEQVGLRPDAVAVIDGERTLTYGALDAASNRLARHLIGLGVGPEQVVGVCLERSAELIVTLLAIWKAGGAYLPLDPEYPKERLAFMLKHGEASLLVTSADCRLSWDGTRTLTIESADTTKCLAALSPSGLKDGEAPSALNIDRLAYVVYTSGSTGLPNAVTGTVGNLFHLASGYIRALKIQPGRMGLQRAPYTWLASLEEILPMLASGGSVNVYRDTRFEADLFWQFLAENHVDHIVTLPSIVGTAPDAFDFKSRSVVVTGERPKWSSLEAAAAVTQVWNSFGATETAAVVGISCSIQEVHEAFLLKPFGNAHLFILDGALNPVPVGVSGELFVGSDAVARGYMKRPGLTAEKFIADQFSTEPGARLYRTGDLARWRSDGTLEFLGRMDHQVKIRGMRVELGEIEAQLSALEGVRESVVVARQNGDGDASLVAYLVPESVPEAVLAETLGVPLSDLTEAVRAEALAAVSVLPAESLFDLEDVRSGLKRILPDHMVPAGYVGLTRLPLTSSGKIDRKALPEVAAAVQRAAYVAPQTEMEVAVAEAIAELLDLERVGRHDNFFDLGGHSLLAVRLAARLEVKTGKALQLRTIFEHPTVDGLASALDLTLFVPTDEDIQILLNEPDMAAEFDEAFGAGKAQFYLERHGAPTNS